jgi:hypothetical protein
VAWPRCEAVLAIAPVQRLAQTWHSFLLTEIGL